MMTPENKPLLIGAGACILVVLIVQFGFISPAWSEGTDVLANADRTKGEWDAFFAGGANMMPKPKGMKLIDENKKLLDANLTELTRIELGTLQALKPFSEDAAGSGDKKNFLETKRKQVMGRFSTKPKFDTGAVDMGMTEKVLDDSVGTNLMRLWVVQSFLTACTKSDVETVTILRSRPLSIVDFNETEKSVLAPPDEDTNASRRSSSAKADDKKKDADESPAPGRLVQFPLEASVLMPEKSIGKLLFELQRPTDSVRGYLAIRGFHVLVKDSKSGLVEVSILASGLLNEKAVGEIGIPLKDAGKRGGAGPARRGEIRDLY
jgi:hypothetical protein